MDRRGATSQRHPWMHYVIWGWRREIGMGVGTVVILSIAREIGSAVPATLVVAAVLSFRASPNLRRKAQGLLRSAIRERRLQQVFWWSDIVGRDGRLPIVRREMAIPAGARFLLQLPVGIHLAYLEARLGELTAALNARTVRVRPWRGGARYVELVVITKDPFARVVRSSLAETPQPGPRSLWEAVELGVGEDGRRVSVDLPEHNLLIGGEPGAGKSVALSCVVAAAALDPTCELTLLDPKEVELLPWRDVARRVAGPSSDEAIGALEVLHEVLAARYRSLVASGLRKVERARGDGLHVVVIDELAWFLRGGERASRERFTELLRDLVARGRAAGIIVVAATQKPSHDVVPTAIRDLFSYRLAMRCTSPEASDTILGQGWASQGFNAASVDPAQRGVGFLLAEGGVPQLFRAAFLSDEEVAAIAARSREIRAL